MPGFTGIDSAIAQGVQTPNSFQTIGNMLNMVGGAQTVQQQNIQLQAQTQANNERVAKQQFFQNPSNWQDDNGMIDMGKINAVVPKIAPMTGADTIQKLTTLSTAQTQAEQAKLNFTGDERAAVGQLYGVLGRAGITSPAAVSSELDNLATQYPNSKPMQQYIAAAKVGLQNTPGGPGLPGHLITQSQALMSAPQQQASLAPSAGPVNLGGSVGTEVTTPAVGGAPPNYAVVSPGTAQTLPPTATTFNPATQAPQYVGSSATQAGAVNAGPSLGQQQLAGNIAGQVATDWTTTQNNARNASQDIGVLQEIKKYAPQAIAGQASSERQMVNGFQAWLGQKVGLTNAQLAKTDTDLLAKNEKMLALAGGDTNLSKTLAEGANPHLEMSIPAIVKASNQIIGQRQLAISRQQFLLPYINDPAQYNAKSTQFNAIADPRILQLPSLSTQEQIEMKKAMSPAEQAQFGNKIRAMQQLGILQ